MSFVLENIICFLLDYYNDEDVKLVIKSIIKKNGLIILVVVWVYISVKYVLLNICKELDLLFKIYSLFYILGSKVLCMFV